MGRFETDYLYGLTSKIEDIENVFEQYYGVVIFPSDTKENAKVARQVKETKLDAKFGAWIEPQNFSSVKNLEFDLIKLHPAYSGMAITHHKYNKIFNLAEEREVPVICHTGEIEITDYKHVIDRAQEYPHMTFILGHMGGRKYQKTWQCPIDAKPYDNIIIDTTMKIKGWMIKHCQDVIGSKRMIFGSDYPLMHPEVGLTALRESGVDIFQIAHNTAEDLLW